MNVATPWDERTYDRSQRQQAWASEVLARLPEERRQRFTDAVVAGVRLPLDYVRLNVSAVRAA